MTLCILSQNIAVRRLLYKNPRVLRSLFLIRSLFVFGPLRSYVVGHYQKMNKNPRLETYSTELFPNLDVEQIVTTMNAKGYADGVEAPGDVVAQIINFCDS